MKKNWNPKWRTQGEESGYFADEEQLLSMLEDWGVSLEGIYKYLIY